MQEQVKKGLLALLVVGRTAFLHSNCRMVGKGLIASRPDGALSTSPDATELVVSTLNERAGRSTIFGLHAALLQPGKKFTHLVRIEVCEIPGL